MRKYIHSINIQRIQKVICLAIIMLAITTISHAQIGDPGGNGGSGDPDDVPVDGGISILVAAGVGYGVKKVREKRKAAAIDNQIG